MRFGSNVFGALCCSILLLSAGEASATAECTGNDGICGTPEQSGGGCGCGCGCSILVAMTDRGDTYQFADDFDGDGIEDEFDGCPFVSDFVQQDSDSDGVGDACDSCAAYANADQGDLDGDGIGDACDSDSDGDGWDNGADGCPSFPDTAQLDTDLDGLNDACDDDDDNDSFLDAVDGCRLLSGTDPSAGCEDDPDDDGINDGEDNCPGIQNGDQADLDDNGIGDLCDSDLDGDGVLNFEDNCESLSNPEQIDVDGDGLGDGGLWGMAAASCDQRECYVVPGQADCLDPAGGFNIGLWAIGTEGQFKTGSLIRVGLATNRLQQRHTWTATLTKLPEDSKAVLVNARGAASTWDNSNKVVACKLEGSSGCEDYNYIRFEPDAPGTYVIRVDAELPAGDPLNVGAAVASSQLTIKVGGKDRTEGCAAGIATPMMGLALGVLALLRRKRG